MNLDRDDIQWLESYAAKVRDHFNPRFDTNKNRFLDGRALLTRFDEAVQTVVNAGKNHFGAVDEAHNEICAADAILSNDSPKFVQLDYEPPLRNCVQTIDFRATLPEGQFVYVDVKTIKPKPRDRWEQFERAQREGWIPANVRVVVSKEWMGGEIWHAWFAARSRMLEYALELERKADQAQLLADGATVILALCGDGFGWQQDNLEDFVSLYRTGRHRADDQFSEMELKHMAEKNIVLKRTIARFAYFRRKQGQIIPNHTNWNVRPPHDPFS